MFTAAIGRRSPDPISLGQEALFDRGLSFLAFGDIGELEDAQAFLHRHVDGASARYIVQFPTQSTSD